MSHLLWFAVFSQTLTETVTHMEPLKAPRVDIVGQGFNGTDPVGPILQFAGCDGLELGQGDPFRATGSHIERVRIVTNGTGGTALKFFASSKAERPGEIVIRDVKIMGMSDLNGRGKNNWNHGLVIDGGELNEVNAAGIRKIIVENLRVAGCQSDSIILRNVTHFHGHAIEIDNGTAMRESPPRMIIEHSRHVFLSQMNLFGEVVLRDCQNVILDGYAQVVTIEPGCKGIMISGIVDRLLVDKDVEGRCDAMTKKVGNISQKFRVR